MRDLPSPAAGLLTARVIGPADPGQVRLAGHRVGCGPVAQLVHERALHDRLEHLRLVRLQQHRLQGERGCRVEPQAGVPFGAETVVEVFCEKDKLEFRSISLAELEIFEKA